jgi:hypothetical protein
MDVDDEDEDNDHGDDSIFPAKLIKRENRRHSFFRTILNPEHEAPASHPANSIPGESDPLRPAPIPNDLNDPITAKIINEEDARVIFDLVFLRLNPFINLFDPALHSVAYVRSKCPLLFTALIMAGAKFFRPEIYRDCQKLANDLAVRAFAEQWKRVEVVQAFACLTYWKEPDDNVRGLDKGSGTLLIPCFPANVDIHWLREHRKDTLSVNSSHVGPRLPGWPLNLI